jgi:hypothetical protein
MGRFLLAIFGAKLPLEGRIATLQILAANLNLPNLHLRELKVQIANIQKPIDKRKCRV